MEEEYYARIHKQYIETLATIRKWQNLKVATVEDFIWIGNFSQEQIESKEVRGLPNKEVFYCKNTTLYPLGSKLPFGHLPSLLFTPIERALPITIESFNHNLFEINGEINIQLVQCDTEQDCSVMLVDIDALGKYIVQCPKVRMKNLKWVVLNKKEALLIGKPLLPLNGSVFWEHNSFIIPSGFMLNVGILQKVLQLKLDKDEEHYILWHPDASYSKISKDSFMPLSIGSYRQTQKNIAEEK